MVNQKSEVQKLLIITKHVRKNFQVSPKFIIFNKSIIVKHPNIELNTTSVFKSIIHMFDVLNTEEACRKHLEKLRWKNEPICLHCGSQRAVIIN